MSYAEKFNALEKTKRVLKETWQQLESSLHAYKMLAEDREMLATELAQLKEKVTKQQEEIARLNNLLYQALLKR